MAVGLLIKLLSLILNDPDLFLCETVEVVDEAVDPAVGGVDEAEEKKATECFSDTLHACV